ncbi:hypothetical protein BDF14DRAFT_1751744 [Spinellus fusiger]|nr:hypothetical protein BDF14DRAFT_1751744 [Spinellus fusiger]
MEARLGLNQIYKFFLLCFFLLVNKPLMASLEDTKAMIQQLEDLLAVSPTDTSLLNMLADLYELLEAIKPADTYPCGTKCTIPFSCSPFGQVLLPALILERTTTHVLVLIITPITQETVPCTDYVAKHACQEPCPHQRSHGYSIAVDELLSYDAMQMTDMTHYNESKQVWCKVGDSSVWQAARIVNQVSSKHWRVRCTAEPATLNTVTIESIIPLRLFHGPESLESDESESDVESEHSCEPELQDPASFGSWQVHTTGFAAKMMKKMGYAAGKGLGIHGQGRVEPIQVLPYTSGKRMTAGQERPGLGSQPEVKKKATRTRALPSSSVFDFLNTTLATPKSVVVQPSSKKPVVMDPKEAQRHLNKLQAQIKQTSSQLSSALESVKRNKDTPMLGKFKSKAEEIAKTLERLKKEEAYTQGSLRRTKDREKMVSF